ncbi:MAG: mannose-1-phosphate guanylyltransferase [Planctomycetota bacterium]
MRPKNLWAVLMAGGTGTRFWPASRRSIPKQFLPIAGGRSLLAETAARLRGAVGWERMIVVTSREHANLARKHLPRLPPENVLAEPLGRNTAACVAWAALEIEKREPDSLQAVLPSDHVIAPAKEFRKALGAAAEEAGESGGLVTFGIRPTFPATGYGWIEAGSPVAQRRGIEIRRVERFVEKPDRPRAEAFLASGRHLWNSGMFVWRTDAILRAMREHAGALHERLRRAMDDGTIESAYADLPSISIDVAILERAADVRVVPVDFTWSDVGSWSALPSALSVDDAGNCPAGGAVLLAEDSTGCVSWGRKGELTALLGVHDLVVVHAGKVTLVCPRDRAEDVRQLVARLEREAPSFR